MNTSRLQAICRELLGELGYDPDAPELAETPRRWAAFWREFIEYDPGNTDTSFEAIQADQLIVLRNVRVWSLCEHHLLPFHCDLSIGYLSETKILGISKLARIAHKHAHRLQLQERLVRDIAEDIASLTGSENVGVIGRGSHLCMVMRGIMTPSEMVTSEMRGKFRTAPELRREFMALAEK